MKDLAIITANSFDYESKVVAYRCWEVKGGIEREEKKECTNNLSSKVRSQEKLAVWMTGGGLSLKLQVWTENSDVTIPGGRG